MTALAGGLPDRPPISFDWQPGLSLPNRDEVYDHFGAADKQGLYAAAGIDGFSVWEWNAVEGRYVGPPRRAADGTGLDFWGNAYPGHFGLAACDTVEALRRHRWPRAEDFDFGDVADQARAIRDQDMPVAAGHLGLGYQMHNMLRGNEKALLDVCDEGWMAAYLEHLTDFTVAYITALLEAADGLVDVVRADDDVGTMDRLMISPAMWRRYYKPAWRAAFDVVHRHGAKVWFHSCGYIMPLLEDLIEIGVDCWNPFPPRVKDNEHDRLRQVRRGRLALDGGVDHFLLVEGTPGQVRDATRRVLDLFGPDGGLLVGPAQVFTPDMPAANIIALLETALAYRG